MIKVNFNQKKTENLKPETKGLAATGTTQIYTQVSKVAKEVQDIIGAQSLVKIILNLVLILAFPGGLKVYEMREIQKLTKQKNQEQSILDQKNQELSALKQELDKYAYLKELANEFENKRSFLRGISEARLLAPRVIDFIQNQIPKDVWLSDIKIDLKEKDERKLLLTGFSFKETSINYFTNNLHEILHEGSVSVDTKDVKDGESILKINFNLKGDLI